MSKETKETHGESDRSHSSSKLSSTSIPRGPFKLSRAKILALLLGVGGLVNGGNYLLDEYRAGNYSEEDSRSKAQDLKKYKEDFLKTNNIDNINSMEDLVHDLLGAYVNIESSVLKNGSEMTFALSVGSNQTLNFSIDYLFRNFQEAKEEFAKAKAFLASNPDIKFLTVWEAHVHSSNIRRDATYVYKDLNKSVVPGLDESADLEDLHLTLDSAYSTIIEGDLGIYLPRKEKADTFEYSKTPMFSLVGKNVEAIKEIVNALLSKKLLYSKTKIVLDDGDYEDREITVDSYHEERSNEVYLTSGRSSIVYNKDTKQFIPEAEWGANPKLTMELLEGYTFLKIEQSNGEKYLIWLDENGYTADLEEIVLARLQRMKEESAVKK